MNLRKHYIKVLCLSAMAMLSMAAFTAAGAQAAEWTIGGKPLTEVTAEELTLSIDTSVDVDLGFLQIGCKKVHTHTTIKKNGINDGSIGFSSCEVRDQNGKPAGETCKVTENFTFKAKGLLSKDAMYDVFSSSGATFASITVESTPGKECLLIEESPEVFEVTGTIGALVSGNALMFSEAIETAAGTKLEVGGHSAFIEGAVKQELIGPHKGEELGAIE